MITFKQYLEESRSAPLYHGTALHRLIEIGYAGDMKGLENRVSFTRDFGYAKRWPEMQQHARPVVIEFDQLKLTTKYKIKPINYWNTKHSGLEKSGKYPARMSSNFRNKDNVGELENEYEESINGIIRDAFKYMTKIYVVSENDKKSLIENVLQLSDTKYKIEVVVGMRPKR